QWADGVIAFVREHAGERILVIAPRLAAGIMTGEGAPDGRQPLVPAEAWGDTAVILPETCAGWRWQSAFDEDGFGATDGRLMLADVLRRFPLQLAHGVPAP